MIPPSLQTAGVLVMIGRANGLELEIRSNLISVSVINFLIVHTFSLLRAEIVKILHFYLFLL